jgi:hypothetical protein
MLKNDRLRREVTPEAGAEGDAPWDDGASDATDDMLDPRYGTPYHGPPAADRCFNPTSCCGGCQFAAIVTPCQNEAGVESVCCKSTECCVVDTDAFLTVVDDVRIGHASFSAAQKRNEVRSRVEGILCSHCVWYKPDQGVQVDAPTCVLVRIRLAFCDPDSWT